MDRLLCSVLDSAVGSCKEGCRRAVSCACPSLSLGVLSPAHSAGLEITTEENWEDDCYESFLRLSHVVVQTSVL